MSRSQILRYVPFITLLVMSCASYNPLGVQFRQAEDMMMQETVDEVVWAADGLSGVEFDRIYDWEFSKKGYSAAIIAVRNNSTEEVRFSWQDVEGAIDPSTVAEKGQRSIPKRLLAWSSLTLYVVIGNFLLSKHGNKLQKQLALVFGSILTIIGSIVDAPIAAEANRHMADDFQRLSVKDVIVRPGRLYEGLVYFQSTLSWTGVPSTPINVRLQYKHGEVTKQIELPWY